MKNERILQRTNKKSIYIWTICLLVIAFSIVASTNFIFNTKIAHAEETETQENQIVNFNQIFKFNPNGYISTSRVSVGDNNIMNVSTQFNANSQIAVNPFDFINEHKYYIFVRGSNLNGQRLAFANGGTIIVNYYSDMIYTANANNTCNYLWGYSGLAIGTYYINIIDLTLMYGNNTPDLETLNNIFTSDYYIYTTGTPISLNGLDSYSRGYTAGFNSAWESQNVSYKQFVIGAQSFAFNNQQYTEQSTKTYDAIAGAYAFSGILGIPLGFTSVGGTNYEIDFTLLCSDWQSESLSYKQEFSLYFYYVDNDNNLIQVGKIPYYEINGNYGTYKGSFNCPVDTDTIYLEFTIDPLDNTSTVAVAFSSNITFRSQNIESAINSAFNAGADSMKETYLPGGDLYNEIYRNAYDRGVMDANTNNSVFQDGWHFIASAFGSVGEILSVELIPGVQIGVFVALPVLLGLIVLIIKILGKGS